MMEFFRGWRRKIGVVTLVMACVFMAGWVRSIFTFDLIHNVTKTSFVYFTSNNGVLMWSSGTGHDFGPSFTWQSRQPFALHWRQYDGNLQLLKWFRWQYLEVHTVRPDGALGQNTGHYVHYGSIVVPLTVLSALLLIHVPCRSTAKRIDEPASNEGATA